jgi:hypothetical protein
MCLTKYFATEIIEALLVDMEITMESNEKCHRFTSSSVRYDASVGKIFHIFNHMIKQYQDLER